jgi:hypothetical protein
MNTVQNLNRLKQDYNRQSQTAAQVTTKLQGSQHRQFHPNGEKSRLTLCVLELFVPRHLDGL